MRLLRQLMCCEVIEMGCLAVRRGCNGMCMRCQIVKFCGAVVCALCHISLIAFEPAEAVGLFRSKL